MKFKALMVLLAITAILLILYTLGNADDRGYNYRVITNDNSITTYTDRQIDR